MSEAKGKAQVIVIILGLSKDDRSVKRLFDNNNIEKNPKHISPYLIGTDHVLPLVQNSKKLLNKLPLMKDGSKPVDGGNFIFTDDEKNEFLNKEPNAKKLLKPFINAKTFINGGKYWILDLHNLPPNELQKLPLVLDRIEKVKEFRLNAKDKLAIKAASTPTNYYSKMIPTAPFLLIPSVSSENREYVPMGYLEPPIIVSNASRIIQNADIALFGLLTSKMHMVWLRSIGGRLKNDLRYSIRLVYNTFPIPDGSLDILTPYAEKILEIRKKYSNSTLANLYDPLTMPSDLKKAHNVLDNTVEKLYRKNKPFESDSERLKFLLIQYNKMIT